MRDIDTATNDALNTATLRYRRRNLFWITPRNASTGADETPVGYWDDAGDKTIDVVDGVSGSTVTRTYRGSTKAIAFDPIILQVGIAVRTTAVELNTLSTSVNTLIRGYDLRKAPVEIHRALFDPITHAVTGVPVPRFVGFVNTITINTPQAGGQGSVRIELVSHSRTLTRGNPAMSSDDEQQARHSGDRFFQYGAIRGERQIFWGTGKSAVAAAAKQQQDAQRRMRLLFP